MSSRPAGQEALVLLAQMLSESEAVELDFEGLSLTPSFADEFLGGAAARLGIDEFRRRIVLTNIADNSRPLVLHVLARGFRRKQVEPK
jgi:hypothetical protein